jgi:hypothetical protein
MRDAKTGADGIEGEGAGEGGPSQSPVPDEPAFDAIAATLRDGGPVAALDRLAGDLDAAGDFRALLDAKLLKARHELGLPLVAPASLADLDESVRTQYEEKYVEAIRLVGSKHLARGDIPTAWAYFRVIGENQPIARAIDEFRPDEHGGDGERLGAIIEVAFNHGVHPRRGFELILEHYGTCSAISAFEGLPGHDEAVRVACAERLIGQLHRDVAANIRGDIAGRGQLAPPAGASIAELIAGRDWLFAEESYHIDISHLASVVRMSVLAADPAAIAMAADLTEYGRRLSPRLQFEGVPPFERIFDDHRVYLRALLGHDVEAAIAHFRGKLGPAGRSLDPESPDPTVPAQTLVNLLVRLGRLDEAIEVSSEYLAGVPEASLFCPGVAQLCQRAGDPGRLAEIARGRGDLVNYTAALLSIAGAVARGS